MINDCNTKNPLQRDGTSQQQRLLKALLPSYVSVDERSMQDLITFANNFGTQINYYDVNNIITGDWQSFFKDMVIDEDGQTTQPHYALFIAFLEIFRVAQTDLNTITQRHLDFYYRDVLQLKEKDAVPDQVFIIFTLAQQIASHLVTKDTQLDAKKDATGVDLIYDTEKDIVVNTAQVAELKALFYNKQFDKRLYSSPIANSADGIGKEIEGDEKKWQTFGSISDPSLPFNSALINRPQANVGFAFASPILQMGEGNRAVQITLSFAGATGISDPELLDAFSISFSGEKDWITPSTGSKLPTDRTYNGSVGTNTIIIERTITTDQPAIVNYNKDVLKDPFTTSWPIVRIQLNTAAASSPYLYERLKSLVLNSATISVDVDGVKNLILQNDQSTLDAAKPFQPFGNRPVLTSSFYIGSQEIFSKSLTSLDVNITWKGLPENDGGFGVYYDHYIPVTTDASKTRVDANFKAEISILQGKEWGNPIVPSSSTVAKLFNTVPNASQKVDSVRDMNISGTSLAGFRRDADFSLETLTKYDNNTPRGFLRLELANIDFGHHDFQNSFATQALIASKDAQDGKKSFSLPNEPYTPLVSDINLSYTSSVTIQLVNNAVVNSPAGFDNRVDQFFHIEPFGVAESHPFIVKQFPSISLFPVYKDEGSLYIGLSDLHPSETLSVLFKVAEGSANPDFERQPVKWSYMVNNEWNDFPPLKVLSDTTNGLLTSGIITFDISKFATSDNTVLTTGLHWLKASVENYPYAVCDMIDIRTQAVLSEFKDHGNDPNHLLQSLPAGIIKDLIDSDGAIDKIEQPYASFGGKIKEQSNEFYTRVSERLRHKNRATNIWDYEHLVLERFPGIYKVKCLNHTRYISASDIKEIAPGHVSVIAIADLKNKNAVNPLKPKTSLIVLTEIEQYLAKLCPPCATLHVKNPLYEEIAVEFNVRFLPGFDNGFYGQKLEEDIKKFLAPWAYNVTDISFGGKIHKSVLINFVEEQSYVDFVTCFKMDHIVGTTVHKNIDEAFVTTSASILTSASSHTVHVLETDDCECDDNLIKAPYPPVDKACDCGCSDCDHGPKKAKPRPFGVGAFGVGLNNVVGNGTGFTATGVGFMKIGSDFKIE
ncbi:MAG: baseplate J/gp47 family protein [Bacteroidia bacterium]